MFTVISILIIAEAFSGNLVNAECKEYGFHKWVSESIGGNYGLEYIEVTTPKNKEHYMLGRNFDNSIFLCEQLCLRDSTCVGINLAPVVGMFVTASQWDLVKQGLFRLNLSRVTNHRVTNHVENTAFPSPIQWWLKLKMKELRALMLR